MDLSAWDFAKNGSVELGGDYAFFWKEFLDPSTQAKAPGGRPTEHFPMPAFWNGRRVVGPDGAETASGDGYATYRLQVLLPATATALGLRVPTMHTAFRLYANGALLISNGSPGTSESASRPAYAPAVVRLPIAAEHIEITIHLSNFHHSKGGTWRNLRLGQAGALEAEWSDRRLYNSVLFGGLLVMGLYHLGIFAARRKARSAPFFGLFCLLIAVRIFTTGQHQLAGLLPWLSWEAYVKIQYLSYYLAVPCFAAFTHFVFPGEIRRRLLWVLVAACGIPIALVVVSPVHVFSQSMMPFQIMTLAGGAYLLVALAISIRRKREGALLYLAGWIVFFATVINDILFNSGWIASMHLSPLGLLFFVIAQATLLSRRYANAFHLAEVLSADLEGRIQERTRELQDSRDELRMARDNAVRSDQAKSTFLATMSHEIRTPLNSILGASSLLEESDLTKEQREQVSILVRAGRRLLALITEILDLSKVESGKMEMVFVPFELRALIQDVVNIMGVRAAGKGVALDCNYGKDVPNALIGDPTRLEQVLLNLVGNAIKFTEEGSITITVRQVEASGSGIVLTFAVKDTGIGIPVELQERIFESFVQVDQRDARRFGGTGLGLSISSGLVRLLGGKLEVRSDPGAGSEFFFTLSFQPAWESDSGRTPREFDAAARERDNPKLQKGLRLLLVDDNEDNRYLMELLLRGSGVDCDLVGDGAEAVQRASTTRYDLIFMDLHMPGMDGYEAVRSIREWERSQDVGSVPILALTADATPDARTKAIGAGCDGFLTKPIQKADLLRAVQRYTETTDKG